MVHGVVPLTVNDVPGVIIAGVTIDAGSVESPILLQVGKKPKKNAKSHPSDPTTLSDVYFRVGGPTSARSTWHSRSTATTS